MKTTQTIALRAATARGHNPDRYADSLRRIIATSPDEGERKVSERRLRELRMRQYRDAGNAASAQSERITRQDPLWTFEHRYQTIGLLMRLHRESGLVVFGACGNFSGDYIEGGSSDGMEAHTDRRRKGERIWGHALDAIQPRRERGEITLDRTDDYRDAVTGVIMGKLSLDRAAQAIGYAPHSDGGRCEIKRATMQALDAAQDVAGVG